MNHVHFVDGPAAGKVLTLARTPRYMRAVCQLDGTWDALDLLEDECNLGDVVHVYRRGATTGHVCYRDKRGCANWIDYHHEPAIDPEGLEDNDAWRAAVEAVVAGSTV